MKKISRKPINKPLRSPDVPATGAMLFEMEERLNHKMDSGFQKIRSEFSGLRSEFSGLKSEFSILKSEIHGVKSEIHGMKSELHRVALLVEEQNARNKYVMDGYTQLYELLINKLGGVSN